METAVDIRPRMDATHPPLELFEHLESVVDDSNIKKTFLPQHQQSLPHPLLMRKVSSDGPIAEARQSAARAAAYAEKKDLKQALRFYGEALEGFQRAAAQTDDSSWVLLCHAANCLTRMGDLHKSTNSHAATLCWEQSDVLYRNCRQFLLAAAANGGGNGGDDEDVKNCTISDTEMESVTHSLNTLAPDKEHLCLDVLIVETLQKRAAAQSLHPNAALECHEDVIEFLMDLNKSQNWGNADQVSREDLHVVDCIVFRPITKEQHTRLLALSLERLGSLYRSTRSEEGRLRAIVDALDLIRQRRRDFPDDGALLNSLLRILRNLSQVYLELGDLDRAFGYLNESFDIQLSENDEPPEEALDAMDKMGALYEQSENFDGAMACYERTLLLRSRFWGNRNLDVAKSLISIARVMELQGNVEGSLDLYKAAKSIYADQLASGSFDVETDDAVTLLNDLFPVAMQQGRYKDAIAYLSKCVEVAEDESRQDSIHLDKTVIYFKLGEAYIGLRDYVSATVCLVEAAKHDGEIHEEQVFALLQHVEFLQRGEHKLEQNELVRGRVSSQLSKGERQIGTLQSEGPPAEHVVFSKVNKDEDVTYESEIDDVETDFYNSDFSVSETSQSSHEPLSPESEDISQCLPESDISQSILESDMEGPITDIDVSLIELKKDQTPETESPPIPSRTSMDPDTKLESKGPRKDTSVDRSQGAAGGLSVKSIRGSLRIPFGSSQVKKDEESSKSSQRTTSIARSFSSRFLRPRGSRLVDSKTSHEQKESPTLVFPSEEDYHTNIDGPIHSIIAPSNSWQSNVSEITMRIDDTSNSKESTQEWWWGVTAEGFGRWFPTAYVSKAVELADGFLSARAIHNKKKQQTPLEYVSDEESIENSDSFLRDHLSHVGVADAKTAYKRMIKTDFTRTSFTLPIDQRRNGALSIYPGRHQQQGKDTEAEIRRYTEQVKTQRAKFGKDHPEVATSLFTLAVLYSRNQAPAPAIEAAAEALRIQKAASEYDDTARSLHFLADLYLHQKEYSNALTYYMESLRLERKQHGDSSDEVAKTLNCIGTVYSLQNDFSHAINSHQEALRILKDCHGEDPKQPLVSETLCQIGAVYYRERNSLAKVQVHTDEEYTTFIEAGMLETIGRAHEERGSYKLALSFFEEKLQYLEGQRSVGDNFEDIASTLNSLGMLSARAGLLVEAIDFYERALKTLLQLGCDRVQVATARVLTGAVHFQLGDWTKALRLHHEALSVLQDELGGEHETVAAALYQIGVVHIARFEFDSAKTYLNKALKTQNVILGANHPATLRTRREILNIDSFHASKLDSVLDGLNDILEVQQVLHGERHPNIAETLFSIGRAYALKDDISSALQLLEECYYMRTESLGWEHPAQATTLHEICRIHLKRGRVKRALHICDVVLGIRTELLTEEHVDVALALATKASCFAVQQKREDAKALFKEALTMAENAVGRSHPIVADIHLQVAEMHWQNCRFQESRLSIEVAIRLYRNARLAEDHPSIKDALKKLERVKRSEMLYV